MIALLQGSQNAGNAEPVVLDLTEDDEPMAANDEKTADEDGGGDDSVQEHPQADVGENAVVVCLGCMSQE